MECPLILIALGISLVSGFASQATKNRRGHVKNACFQLSENRVRENDEPLGKGNNRGKAPIKAPLHKTMHGEQIPDGLIQQTMPDTTVGPDVTINLGNQVAKSENQKSMRYRRDTISTVKQHPMT